MLALPMELEVDHDVYQRIISISRIVARSYHLTTLFHLPISGRQAVLCVLLMVGGGWESPGNGE